MHVFHGIILRFSERNFNTDFPNKLTIVEIPSQKYSVGTPQKVNYSQWQEIFYF